MSSNTITVHVAAVKGIEVPLPETCPECGESLRAEGALAFEEWIGFKFHEATYLGSCGLDVSSAATEMQAEGANGVPISIECGGCGWELPVPKVKLPRGWVAL